ncbi:MAG: hypothetical protein IJQ21_13015 [Lachnospiraceae bacterium]|nr:hypothetical protein [Lachnospiraceae bacterium]
MSDVRKKEEKSARFRQTRHGLREYAMPVVCLIFFTGFALIDGPFLESDSATYYTFNVFREPGYPLFLAFCRLLPGASVLTYDGYAGLYHAVFLQSLIWAFAVWRVGVCTTEIMRAADMCADGTDQTQGGPSAADADGQMGPALSKPVLAGWGAVCIHFATCLMHRFLSQRGALYSNSILTEALAMPLFLVFIVQLFYLLRDRGAAKRVAAVAALSLLLIILRKHMTVTLLIWGFMALVLHLLMPETRHVRRFLAQCAVIVCVFAAAQLFTRVYNLAAFGSFSPQAGSHEGMMCMFLYVSDEADTALFREGEEAQRQWFAEIAAAQTARGARRADVPAGASWYERQKHFTDCYDVIGYEIAHDVLFAGAENRIGADAPYQDKVRLMYDLEGELVPVLRRQGFADYLRVYADNLLAGLLASTTRIGDMLLPVTLMLFVCYAVLLVRTGGRVPGQRGRSADAETLPAPGGITQGGLFSLLVIAALFVNAGVVAAVIFSQARYDSYLTGLFYTAMLLMGLNLRHRQGAGS